MSTLLVRNSDRPPEGGWRAAVGAKSLARLLLDSILVLGFILTLVATGWAQAGRPPRTDPGDPPQIPADNPEGWQAIAIPGLPANTALGDLWVAPGGDLFVWAIYAAPQRNASDEPGEGDGERLPNPKPSSALSSTLYRFDGLNWTMSLVAPAQAGATVYGTGPTDIWASTVNPQGQALLYRFDGVKWALQALPGSLPGSLHTLAGAPGDVYFRVDRVLMRDTGSGMKRVYEMPANETPVRGMVYLDASHVYLMCDDGCMFGQNATFGETPNGAPLGSVQDAWGARDAMGAVQVLAVGTTLNNEGIRIWRFTETDPLTHAGDWLTVLADPPRAGTLDVGTGLHVWGSATNDLYATGVVSGEAHILRSDGLTWLQLLPPFPVASIHGVSGLAGGAVWFSADAGRVIRYLPAPRTLIAPLPGPATAQAPMPFEAKAFLGGMRIHYELAAAVPVQLGVYDLAGRRCATVEEGYRSAGVHETTWGTGSLVPGVYFVRLRAGGPAFTRRVVVLR